ncbi:MAG TPA: hypothetical protein VH234_02875 [Candidatus Saccharimonadales bacterium]|jgi:hypothetical protein|nr:hypothetical protein [Candidatus Saccharimonadales bacterium]
MAEANAFPVERFLVERQDRLAMPKAVGCVDDRYMLIQSLYGQHGGGPDGLGRDLATAQESVKPGSYVRHDRPVHRLALVTHRLLEKFGTEAVMHWACAAYGSALAIDQMILNKPDVVFERTKVFNPDITPFRFDRIYDAKFRLVHSGLVCLRQRRMRT